MSRRYTNLDQLDQMLNTFDWLEMGELKEFEKELGTIKIMIESIVNKLTEKIVYDDEIE